MLQHQNKQEGRRQFLMKGALKGAAAITSPMIAFTQIEKKEVHNHTKDSSNHLITKTRTLGTGESRMQVSALGLGCMGMSFHRGLIPDHKFSIQLIQKAFTEK